MMYSEIDVKMNGVSEISIKQIKNRTNEYTKIFVWFAAILIIILPTTLFFNKSLWLPYSEAFEWRQPQILTEITMDSVVEQEIYLKRSETSLKGISILLANYNNRENHGIAQVQLIQGNIVDTYQFDVKNVKDNLYFPLRFDLAKFNEGFARLRISGVDTIEGSSVAVYCDEGQLNLEKSHLNDVEQTKPMSLKFDYSIQQLSGINLFVYVLFCILLMATCWMAAFIFVKLSGSENRDLYLFVLSVFVVFLSTSLRFIPMVISPEPYAEQIVNYYHYAANFNFIENLLVKDAGYLPVVQHLIAWGVVRWAGASAYSSVLILNVISLVVISLVCSMFCLKYYSKYLSYEFRFIICIITPIVVSNFENFTFINFLYFGIVYLIALFLMDFKEISLKSFLLLMTIAALFCVSKGFFVIVLPAAMVYFIISMRSSKLDMFYGSVLVISSAVQLLSSLSNAGLWINHSDDTQVHVANRLFSLAYDALFTYSRVLLGMVGFKIIELGNYLIITVGMLVLLFCMTYVFVNMRRETGNGLSKQFYITLIVINLLLLTTCVFTSITVPYIADKNELIRNRHELFIDILMYYNIILFISAFGQKIKNRIKSTNYIKVKSVCMFLLFAMLVTNIGIIAKTQPQDSLISSNSEWRVFSDLVTRQYYFVPILPNLWRSYSNNSDLRYYGSDERKRELFNDEETDIEHIMPNKEINEIKLEKDDKWTSATLLGIYTKRASVINKYSVILRDKYGNIIAQKEQDTSDTKIFTAFVFADGIRNVASLEFYDVETSRRAYIMPELYLVTQKSTE